jgi:hypothetical protein
MPCRQEATNSFSGGGRWCTAAPQLIDQLDTEIASGECALRQPGPVHYRAPSGAVRTGRRSAITEVPPAADEIGETGRVKGGHQQIERWMS